MGRRKIAIKPITSASSRRATFEKRRIGLIKKAMELSILCECTISLSIQRKHEGDLQIYSSDPYDEVIDNYNRFEGTYKLLTNDHITEMVPGKMSSSQVGYQVNKHSQGITETMNDHSAFQRAQMYNRRSRVPSIAEMEIVMPSSHPPSVMPPSSDLYSMPPAHPTFNGYVHDFNYNNPTLMPPINNRKRSHNDMMDGLDLLDTAFQPPMKQFKIEKSQSNTLNTSHTSSVDVDAHNWIDFELTPPVVEPLHLQLREHYRQHIQKSVV